MKWIHSSPSSGKGFTLVEFMVATLVAAIVILPAVSFTTLHRRVLGNDMVKTRLTQNLRGAMDIVGAASRVAGENLPTSFPAVLVTAGVSDILQLRRNLVDEIVPVCAAVSAGSSQVIFGLTTNPPPGCIYAGQTTAYNAWRTYRLNNSGAVRAYIYDSVARAGEFFTYSNETDSGTVYTLTATAPLGRNYPQGSSSVYILEEWMFQKVDDMLQLVENNDSGSPFNVAFGITNFQVSVIMQDGTTRGTFVPGEQWNQIRSIEIALTGEDDSPFTDFTRMLTARYFPRNVLSN